MIDERTRWSIWSKMPEAEGQDSSKYRLDSCGALIAWDKYGDRQDNFGWEVDHVVPKSLLQHLGASEDEIDDIENLRPMHWRNNDSKSSDYPEYQAKFKYVEGRNKEIEAVFEVNKELQRILKNKYSKYGL